MKLDYEPNDPRRGPTRLQNWGALPWPARLAVILSALLVVLLWIVGILRIRRDGIGIYN